MTIDLATLAQFTGLMHEHVTPRRFSRTKESERVVQKLSEDKKPVQPVYETVIYNNQVKEQVIGYSGKHVNKQA